MGFMALKVTGQESPLSAEYGSHSLGETDDQDPIPIGWLVRGSTA